MDLDFLRSTIITIYLFNKYIYMDIDINLCY